METTAEFRLACMEIVIQNSIDKELSMSEIVEQASILYNFVIDNN
jgi:hypothetical protein